MSPEGPTYFPHRLLTAREPVVPLCPRKVSRGHTELKSNQSHVLPRKHRGQGDQLRGTATTWGECARCQAESCPIPSESALGITELPTGRQLRESNPPERASHSELLLQRKKPVHPSEPAGRGQTNAVIPSDPPDDSARTGTPKINGDGGH